MDDLTDHDLGDDVAAFADRNPPPVDPTDADRLLRRLRQLNAEAAAITERANAMRLDIDQWEQARIGPLLTRAEYLTDTLADWLRASGLPSLSSPYGTIRSRKGALSLRVLDEAAAVDVLEQVAPEAVKRTVAVTEARRVLVPAAELDGETPAEADAVNPHTGQLVPGLVWVNPGRSWSVKAAP